MLGQVIKLRHQDILKLDNFGETLFNDKTTD